MSVGALLGRTIGYIEAGEPAVRRALTAVRLLPEGSPPTAFGTRQQAEGIPTATGARWYTQNIVAIVSTDHAHRFYVVDTGVQAPNPPVNLHVFWQPDPSIASAAQFVSWVRVPAAIAPAPPARVARVVAAPSQTDASRRFDARYASTFTADQLQRIHAGINTVLLYHPYLQDTFYDAMCHWILHFSESIDGHSDWDACRTTFSSTIGRSAFCRESYLGGVLVHEMMHIRAPRQSGLNTATAELEGQAWGTQVSLADYCGDEAESIRLTNLMANGYFGGELSGAEVISGRRWADIAYVSWALLLNASDAAAGRVRTLFGSNPVAASTGGNIGSFGVSLMTNSHWYQSGCGADVYGYVSDDRTRQQLLGTISRSPVGVLGNYAARRCRDGFA